MLYCYIVSQRYKHDHPHGNYIDGENLYPRNMGLGRLSMRFGNSCNDQRKNL